jgi:hypothetical protein
VPWTIAPILLDDADDGVREHLPDTGTPEVRMSREHVER